MSVRQAAKLLGQNLYFNIGEKYNILFLLNVCFFHIL